MAVRHLLLVLFACTISSGSTSMPLGNSKTNQVQNLFDSIVGKDTEKIGVYRDALEHEVLRERQTVDALREELNFARSKKAKGGKNLERSHAAVGSMLRKREIGNSVPKCNAPGDPMVLNLFEFNSTVGKNDGSEEALPQKTARALHLCEKLEHPAEGKEFEMAKFIGGADACYHIYEAHLGAQNTVLKLGETKLSEYCGKKYGYKIDASEEFFELDSRECWLISGCMNVYWEQILAVSRKN